MSEIKYGLISQTDAKTIEKTIDLICDEFPNEMLKTCEIGVYAGTTSSAILKYIFNVKKRYTWHTGIDSKKDNEPMVDWSDGMTFIEGNSNEVYNRVADESQHFIFVDADHSKIGVIADFFAYADKVKKGGYMAFHDTGKHIKPFKDFQHGDKANPDAYISVRKALTELGMIYRERTIVNFDGGDFYLNKWQLIFDESDETNNAGGVCVLKKLY